MAKYTKSKQEAYARAYFTGKDHYKQNKDSDHMTVRRKRYIKGRVYYTNDSILVNTKPKKRMVVAVNNNPNEMHVRRILSANKGENSQKGIPIEKYPDIPSSSVIENRTFRRTKNNHPIVESKMKKSSTRLNKWDKRKAGIK